MSTAPDTPWHLEDMGPGCAACKTSEVALLTASGKTIAYDSPHDGMAPSGEYMAFILRAVNNHDALLAVLREIDEYLSPNPQNYIGNGSTLHRKVRDAIQRATNGAE